MVQIRNPLTVVQTGGGGGGGGDRPADWMPMPEIGANEDNVFYFLLMVDADRTEDITIGYTASGGGTKTWEFGTTDPSGNFTPNSALTTTSTVQTLPMSAFGNTTSDGQKQLMCKLSGTGDFTAIKKADNGYGPTGSAFARCMREFKGKGTKLTSLSDLFGTGTQAAASSRIRYFKLLGENRITNFSEMFYNCSALVAVLGLDTSSGTNFNGMFRNCRSLNTLPQLNASSGTSFNNMFNGCYALTTIPQLVISAGTNFGGMFSGCCSLAEADLTGYDFSHITTTSALGNFLNEAPGQLTIEFGDTFGVSGIINTSQILSTTSNMASTTYPLRIKINKTDAMLPIAANATTIFSNGQYVYVYVPDALLATYQADTYWATLGARLKGFSELPS